jgi:N-acetylmuramoyl-L-alanine amidase
MRKNRSKTDYVVWHCSATPPSQDIGSAQIDIMHKARGWDGIGYAMVVRRDGRIETGEDLKKAGAHVKGLNRVSVGIAMIGGVNEAGEAENNFTEAQWKAAKHVFEFFTLLYPDAKHVGHRDLSPDLDADGRVQRHEFLKDCPCYSVSQWIKGDLRPVSDLYAPWEETGSEVEDPEETITFDEVLDDAKNDWDDFVDEEEEDAGTRSE